MNDALELDLAARPRFVDNRDGNTLAEALARHLSAARKLDEGDHELCIAATFFNLGGFASMARPLGEIERVRLLMGAEPLPESRRPVDRTEGEAVREALHDLDAGLRRHRDLLPFDRETDRHVRRLLEFLRRDGVEVRRLEDGYMHAKAWHLRSGHGGLVVGSSNFTRGGMQRNMELNLGQTDEAVIKRVSQWYDELWERAVPFDLAAYYEPLLEEFPPWLIFMRVLNELYGQELEMENIEEGIPLLTFQKHGVWRALKLLERHHGVLIADGVGLGKTFTAGEIMMRYASNRQRVLLVAPAALRDSTWKSFLARHQLFAECVSYEELGRDRQLGGDQRHLQRPIEEYALVVVDEAHAYRNPSAPTRAGVLRRLLQGRRRDLVLLTATPVNNSLWDLYHLLRFFIKQDAALAELGVLSIRDRFVEAMREDPFDLNPDLLFPIVDAVTVKRTRQFISRHYRDDLLPDADGNLQPIRFPKPLAHSVDYDIERLLPGYLERLEALLAPGNDTPKLRLARYKAEKYPKGSRPAPDDTALVGLIRSGLLKRFESSVFAFRRSLERMIEEHRQFIEALDRGVVATKDLLQEISAADDNVDLDELLADHPGGQSAAGFNVAALRADVVTDLDVLSELLEPLERVRPEDDPKLERLLGLLREIRRQANHDGLNDRQIRDNGKVLLFSYFADTVDWVHDYLVERLAEDEELAPYQGRIVSVVGDATSTGEARDVAVSAFAPRSMENPDQDDDRYDLLLSTDVLAEGVNLQQCRNIVNLDMPWNPMRLVQRHGRIDRINSPHEAVHLFTFFPDAQLDRLLKLEQRVRTKLAQAAASVGVEQAPIADAATTDSSFGETREEIERLQQEDASLFERGGTRSAAQSGEEYREQLRRALGTDREAIMDLPWKAGSGIVGDDPGHLFCVRIRERVYLRFVPFGDEQGIDKEIGSCLRRIECDRETERVMAPEMAESAYDAWRAARRSCHQAWMHETDPANLQPRLRPISRKLSEQLQAHPAHGASDRRLQAWVEAVESPIPLREERVLREILEDSECEGSEKSARIGQAIDDLGLEPYEAPLPLPPVEVDEVRLVCWMAVHERVKESEG